MIDFSANLQQTKPERRSLTTQLRLVAIPLGIAVLWWCILGSLAATTTDATTVNLRQLRQANLVLRIRADDVADGRASILAVWDSETGWQTLANETAIEISNLQQTIAVNGHEFFAPVTRGENDLYTVTTFPLRSSEEDESRSQPYLYPVDEDSTAILTGALKRRGTPN